MTPKEKIQLPVNPPNSLGGQRYEKAGIKVDLGYALNKNFWLPKNKGPDFDEEKMKEIAEKIIKDIKEKILSKM